ncbi:MAG: ribonuclease HII [Chromatiales bacterium]|nr:ribonuclease HII [Chromatiales bacterium]
MSCASVILRNQALPDFSERYIGGVDEAGRGALAGPVVAAVVILDAQSPVKGCVDSKKLSESRRDYLAAQIKKTALAWSIGSAENEEIDRLNILNATLLAMQRAIESLKIKPQRLLIDGNRCPSSTIRCHAVINGDNRVMSIAAASILAKTTRDAQMRLWSDKYPLYHLAEHKGYATRKHIAALANYGSCPLHRVSWRKVREVVAQRPSAEQINEHHHSQLP